MTQDTATHPKIRLLHCHDCGTLEELPWYEGPADRDVTLEYSLSKHETNGHRHIGKLYDVEERVWKLENLRRTLIEQIKGGGSSGLAAFDPEFYNTRDTLKEDAATCYQAHLRPKEGCGEWRTDRKKLVPATKKDRKEVGLSMEGAPVGWLCDFCVVRSYYERKNNEAMGRT